jgi:hypothetical protein
MEVFPGMFVGRLCNHVPMRLLIERGNPFWWDERLRERKSGRKIVCNAMSHDDDDADAMGKYVGIVMWWNFELWHIASPLWHTHYIIIHMLYVHRGIFSRNKISTRELWWVKYSNINFLLCNFIYPSIHASTCCLFLLLLLVLLWFFTTILLLLHKYCYAWKYIYFLFYYQIISLTIIFLKNILKIYCNLWLRVMALLYTKKHIYMHFTDITSKYIISSLVKIIKLTSSLSG